MPAYSGPDSDLAPDGATMLAHLRYWFEFSERGEIELGYRDAASGKLNKFERFSPDDFQEAVAWACQANLVPGQDLYYRAATLRPTLERHDTADADVMEAPGAWADQDTPEQVAAAWNAPKDITWTASVVTGRTPHMRVQLLVRTERPIGDPVLIRQLNGRAQALFGGDPTVVNPSRLMRLGGSIAWPWKPDRVPELTEFRLNRELSRSWYPIDTLRARLPPLTNGYAHTWEGGKATWEGGKATWEGGKATWEGGKATWEGGKPSPINPIHGRFVRDRVAELTEELHTPGRWHNSMIRIVAIWVSQHLPDETILHASEQWTQPGYSHEQTRAQVAKAIAGARRKAAPGGPWEQPEQPDPKPGGAPQDAPRRPLALLSMADLDALPDPEWLVGGIVPERSLIVPYGPPKAGKTFVVLSMALHIAAGRDWFGMPVKGGAVVYIAGEGVGGLKLRLRAMRTRYGIGADNPLWILPRPVSLLDPQAVAALLGAIRDACGDTPVRLVVVDTLARAIPGADENSAQEVGAAIAAADRIKDELDATVALVHHEGKDGDRGARGTSALRGAWDAAYRIVQRGKHTVLTVTDQKEAEAGQTLAFRMEEVPATATRTSLVPILGDAPAEPRQPDKPARGLPDGAKIALECLRQAMAGPESSILPPLDGLPTGDTRGVSELTWRRMVYEKYPTDSNDTRKKAFGRAREKLLAERLIGVRDPFVWLTERTNT